MYLCGCVHAVIGLELVCLATCIEPYRVQVINFGECVCTCERGAMCWCALIGKCVCVSVSECTSERQGQPQERSTVCLCP